MRSWKWLQPLPTWKRTLEEHAATVTERPGSNSAAPPPLKVQKVKELIAKSHFRDKYPNIKDALGYFCTSTIPMSMTGMESNLVEKPDDQASVYGCTICRYDTQQKAQAFTHICRVHLGTCLQCHLCDYRTYRGVDMSSHLNKKYANQEDDWVEPLPRC